MAQVSLTNYGGLVTAMSPSSLPEGGSPRNWDVDFVTGGWRQRPGQQNVYSFAGQSIGPNPAFSAVDVSTGHGAWANPANVLLNTGNYATATATSSQTLSISQVEVTGHVGSPFHSFTNFSVVFSQAPPPIIAGQTYTFSGLTTNTWLNGAALTPNAVSGNQASFTIAGTFGAVGIIESDTGQAIVTPAGSFLTDYIDVTNFTFTIPAGQSITGVQASIIGFSTTGQSVSAQLLSGGTAIGNAMTGALPSSAAPVLLGGSTTLWNSGLNPAQAQASTFGVQIRSIGKGTANIGYVTLTLYLTSAQANFNWIGQFTSESGVLYKLALDATGGWWLENQNTAPGQLTLVLSGTNPGGGNGITVYDRAYVANVNLSGAVTGADIPRQYNLAGNWWDRITQVGPAAPPSVSAAQSAGAIAAITAYSASGGVVTLTVSPSLASAYAPGLVVRFSGFTGGAAGLNGQSLIVLGSPAPTTGSFAVSSGSITGSGSDTGTATPQFVYPISTITQPAQMSDPNDPGHVNYLLWSAGPGSTSAGNTITVYYSDSFVNSTPDTTLVNAFNSGFPVYVYIQSQPFGNGVWQVTSIGNAIPPGAAYYRWYFTYQVPTSNYQIFGGPDNALGTYQVTQATVTLSTPVPGVSPGAQVSISGASVPGWDQTFSVVEALNSGAFNITQTSLSGGTATYSWTLTSGAAPSAGQLVTITNTLNANGILNVVDAVIATASGSVSGTFTINGFAANLNFAAAVEEGQATTAGTQFIIDPGAALVGSTTQNPILGNSTGGSMSIVGAASGGTLPIGAGTRQGVIIFVTRNGLYTAPSPPVTFTVAVGSNYLDLNSIPIGPPNVIARLFACTEAGQNGVPGANFYTTTVPTIFTVGGVQYTSSSFLIPDNVSTTWRVTFSDAVLLQSDPIDIPGNNLFNLIEIGNPAAIIQYAERTFYIGCQNKVQNFNNLSFDGGYLAPVGAAPALPLGWSIDPAYSFPFGTSFTITSFSITSNVVTVNCTNTLSAGLNVVINGLSTGTYLNGVVLNVLTANASSFTAAFVHGNVSLTSDSGTVKSITTTISLRPSPVFGNSLYVVNQTASTQAILGMITQSAALDAYNEPILNPAAVPAPYSARITCRCPSGKNGNVVLDLVASNQAKYGASYGSLTIPLSTLTTQMQTITLPLTAASGIPSIPSGLLLRVYGTNMVAGADYEIERIEIFPTNQPVLLNRVLVSYPGEPEQVDGDSGQLTLNSTNQEPVYGATIIRNQLCFKKANSMIECEDAANLEPSQWSTREISARGSGACGPYAFAQGDEWDIGINQDGVYVYSGGQPMPISRELMGYAAEARLWDQVNWNAASTFWIANDINARRMYIGLAMATPNFWLPNAPSNPTPITPNVILFLNYEGAPVATELETAQPVHVTMFGTLKNTDMRRKWSLWNIASPFGGVVDDALEGIRTTYLCNGIASGKIYRLVDCSIQQTDDGVPISPLYTTSSLPGDEKAQTLGIGMGQKIAAKWMAQIGGSLAANQYRIRHLQNILSAQYPVTAAYLPPIGPAQQNNIEWRAEVRGQRIFVEIGVNQNGTPAAGWIEMRELMTEMFPHGWGAFRGVSS